MKAALILCALSLVLTACSTSRAPKPERGPDGTIAHHVRVETDPPGMRIEADGDYVGLSPISVRIFADQDGTFHNFGSFEYVIRATPPKDQTNLFPQTRIFRTGGWFSQEDRVPSRILFDMHQKTSTFSVDRY